MRTTPSNNLKDLDTLAEWLDTKFRGPFGFRFGFDAILGLIPGFGDVATNLMAAYIILKATWHGYPVSVLARMFLNFLFDNLLDAIPLLGGFVDFFFKANIRNMKLMHAYELAPEITRKRSLVWVVVVSAILFVSLLAVMVGAFVLTIIALKALWRVL